MTSQARSARGAADLLPWLLFPLLTALFLSLGFWQLERAEQKRDLEAAFAGAAGEAAPLDPGRDYALYEPVEASGRYLADRQFLIDNIVLDGQLGYYVLTPLEYAEDQPLLVVNRGWFPRAAGDREPPLAVEEGRQSVRGRAGGLPRVALRPGEPFAEAAGWPRTATWPELGDLAGALGREVLPFVLLAEPDPESPLVRDWRPRQVGPMRHVGYAVQWFALAATAVVIGIVLYRKKRSARE